MREEILSGRKYHEREYFSYLFVKKGKRCIINFYLTNFLRVDLSIRDVLYIHITDNYNDRMENEQILKIDIKIDMNEKHIVTLYKAKNKKSKVLFFWKKDIESNNIFYIYVTPEIPKFDEYNFINLRDRSKRGKFSFLLHQTEHLRQTSAARYFSLANDRDNPSVSKRRGRIVAHSTSIPAGLRRSVKPRLHPQERRGEGRADWLIYICPNHRRQISDSYSFFSRSSPKALSLKATKPRKGATG